MDVFFTHKWTWGHQKDVLTNEVQVLVQFKQFGLFKQKKTLAASLCVKDLLNIAGTEKLPGA